MTESVTRVRAPLTEDRYGAQIRDWDNAAELSIDVYAVAPRDHEEEHSNGRAAVLVGFTVYAPAGTDILTTDRLIIRGGLHEVDGEPGVWMNPWSGVTEGIEIRAERVDG